MAAGVSAAGMCLMIYDLPIVYLDYSLQSLSAMFLGGVIQKYDVT